MNLANKLTVLRVLLIPPFVVFLLFGGLNHDNVFPKEGSIPYGTLWALIIFTAASITDWLDGFIARKYNMITDLGKFLDPLADKILVISALVCFVELRWASTWAVIIIIAREFIVTGFRLAVVSRDNNAVIAADIWGKIKTAFTMITIITAMLVNILLKDFGLFRVMESSPTDPFSSALVITYSFNYPWIYEGMIYATAALTVFSGATMIWKNRRLFSEKKS